MNPFVTMQEGFGQLFQETGRIIDNAGAKVKAFFAYGSQTGGTNGSVSGSVTNETKTTITIGTNFESFFIPNGNNKPSAFPFTFSSETTNKTNVTVKATVTLEGVDISTKNVTSQDSSTGEVENSTSITIGKDQSGVFVETDGKQVTSGIKLEEKISVPTGDYLKFGGEISVGNL